MQLDSNFQLPTVFTIFYAFPQTFRRLDPNVTMYIKFRILRPSILFEIQTYKGGNGESKCGKNRRWYTAHHHLLYVLVCFVFSFFDLPSFSVAQDFFHFPFRIIFLYSTFEVAMPFISARDASGRCVRVCTLVSQKSKFFLPPLSRTAYLYTSVSPLSPLVRPSNRLVSLRKEFLFNFYRRYCYTFYIAEKRNQFVCWCHLYVAVALLKSTYARVYGTCPYNILYTRPIIANRLHLVVTRSVICVCIDMIVRL